MNRFFLAVVLLLASFVARGQGCPNGSVALPTGGCGSQAEANDMRQADYDAETAERQRALNGPRWQDRYGAIAVDKATGSYGWAAGASSRKSAKKAAIEDCGGGGCEVQFEGRNTCLATAWGGGVRSFAAKPTLQEVAAAVMERCSKNGTVATCKLDYSACSLPVRVQ